MVLKILLITGKLAEESVKRNILHSEYDVEVYSLPVSVAAFITPERVTEALNGIIQGEYDLILLPGTVRGDVTQVEKAIGIPTFKGPTNADDLPFVLDLLGTIELSKTESASSLIYDFRTQRALEELEQVERGWREIIEAEGGLVIGETEHEVPIGQGLPMRVIAEIVNAPTLNKEAIEARARYFDAEGADIIDIGMLAGKPYPEVIGELIEVVRSSTNLPVSIDTLDPSEIRAAVNAGVDLILSVDRGNMEEVAPVVAETPVVVLPTNMRDGFLPKGADKRVAFLLENIEIARELGITKVIADPVLEPAVKPGLLESLRAYQLFRKKDPSTPVLFGLGNVTELIDVDSTGVNGLLAALATEVDANLLFIPEYSTKARRSVWETAQAAKMMYIANRRERPPKDLGIDLLLLKEKRWTEDSYDRSVEDIVKVVDAYGETQLKPDSKGWFTIQIDRKRKLIIALLFKNSHRPNLIIRGTNAKEIYQTIIRKGLVSKYDHAAYLGKELTKAELALHLGRTYTQDKPLF